MIAVQLPTNPQIGESCWLGWVVTERGYPGQSLAILLERGRQRPKTLEHRESRSVNLGLYKSK